MLELIFVSNLAFNGINEVFVCKHRMKEEKKKKWQTERGSSIEISGKPATIALRGQKLQSTTSPKYLQKLIANVEKRLQFGQKFLGCYKIFPKVKVGDGMSLWRYGDEVSLEIWFSSSRTPHPNNCRECNTRAILLKCCCLVNTRSVIKPRVQWVTISQVLKVGPESDIVPKFPVFRLSSWLTRVTFFVLNIKIF